MDLDGFGESTGQPIIDGILADAERGAYAAAESAAGLIEAEIAFVAVGYAVEFIRYGVTLRGFRARLYGIAQHSLARQREAATALMFGVSALFSKKGFASADGALTETAAKLRAQLIQALRDDAPTQEEARADGTATAPIAPAPPRAPARAASPKQTTADVQRDIRRLDAIMSKLTGKVTRNPAGGYAAGQGVTPFDVHGTPLSELVQRVE